MKNAILLLASVACLLVPAVASAQAVPEYLPYQGYLTSADGVAVDGLVDLTFRIYEGGNDQVALWEEIHRGVAVEDGTFYVQLANSQPVIDDVVEGRTRYLGIAVNQDAEALPRQRIGSVPYALLSADSLALGGVPADEFAPRVEVQNLIDNIVVEGGGITENRVNELIDARNYVNEDAVNVLIDARNYVNEDGVNALIDARNYLDEDAVNALIDARNYVDADAVNALIDARNYLTEDEIIALIDARVADIEQRIVNIENNLQAGNGAYILGVSAQTSNGRFTFNNQNGLQAATEMCRATYPNDATAHLCSFGEVQQALGTGAYRDANNINNTNTWTVGETFVGAAFQGSLANSCQNLAYNSGDAATGTRLSIFLNRQSPGNGGGVVANAFDVRQGIGCNQNMPVLCCR